MQPPRSWFRYLSAFRSEGHDGIRIDEKQREVNAFDMDGFNTETATYPLYVLMPRPLDARISHAELEVMPGFAWWYRNDGENKRCKCERDDERNCGRAVSSIFDTRFPTNTSKGLLLRNQ